MTGRFYTYQHRKADTGEVFYIGKGQAKRATCTHNRNPHWHRTVTKHGFVAETLQHYESEADALDAETKLIAAANAAGIPLVNLTSGGEGWSGRRHSEATRRKISELKRGQVISDAAKRAISEANHWRYRDPEERRKATVHLKGKPSHRRGKKLSEETCRKMSASRTGRVCSPETRQKIAAANRGKVRNEATRAKLSALKSGVRPSEETRRKLSESGKRAWITRKRGY